MQGKVGELAFVHRQDGEILVRRAPVRTKPFTEAELKKQSRFARAVLLRKALEANPDAYAVYKHAAQVRRKRACDLAMADFLHTPVIQNVDLTQRIQGIPPADQDGWLK